MTIFPDGAGAVTPSDLVGGSVNFVLLVLEQDIVILKVNWIDDYFGRVMVFLFIVIIIYPFLEKLNFVSICS